MTRRDEPAAGALRHCPAGTITPTALPPVGPSLTPIGLEWTSLGMALMDCPMAPAGRSRPPRQCGRQRVSQSLVKEVITTHITTTAAVGTR
jgi:hypothetical protein